MVKKQSTAGPSVAPQEDLAWLAEDRVLTRMLLGPADVTSMMLVEALKRAHKEIDKLNALGDMAGR